MTTPQGIAQPLPGPVPTDVAGGEPPQDGPPAPPAPAAAPPPAAPSRRKVALLVLLLGILAAVLALAIWYLLFRQPINPLPNIPSTAVMPSYTTSIYGADRPTGIAVSPSGDRVYVSETEGARVTRVFDAGGQPIGTLEPPTTGDHVPVYLAIDPLTQEVYVTDRPAGTIWVYDRDGVFLREYLAPVGADGWQPLAIAFDSAGNLYVSALGGGPQRVLVVDRAGTVVRTLGEANGLSFPNGIAVDEAGYVYVTDSNNGRLLVFDGTSALAAQVGRGVNDGNLGLPRGLTVDQQGRVYTVDTSGQAVLVYRTVEPGEQRLDYLGFFGGEGISDGTFAYPNGIALDARGRLYVTDSANDRVQVWSY